MTRRTSSLCNLTPNLLLWGQWRKRSEEELANPGSPEKRPLKWRGTDPLFWRSTIPNAKDTRSRNRRQELALVSGTSVIQCGAKFFWRQILESDRTCSISRQNLATMWSKYWFVVGQWSMLMLFSFVGVVNFVCILDYWNYLTYTVYLTWVGWIAR